MINCGLMREVITIQYLETTLNELSTVIENWTDCYKCYAYANGLSGNEFYEARKQNLQETINFTIRYSPRLADLNTSDYRIIWRGKIYDITFIDNYQFKNETLKISAICNGLLEGDQNR